MFKMLLSIYVKPLWVASQFEWLLYKFALHIVIVKLGLPVLTLNVVFVLSQSSVRYLPYQHNQAPFTWMACIQTSVRVL